MKVTFGSFDSSIGARSGFDELCERIEFERDRPLGEPSGTIFSGMTASPTLSVLSGLGELVAGTTVGIDLLKLT